MTKKVAGILRVIEEYLRLLLRKKKIAAYKEGRSSGYRIAANEIDNYIARKHNSER